MQITQRFLCRLIAAVKQAGHAIHRLPLPRADHRVVHTMLGRQFSQRQIAPDRLHRNLQLVDEGDIDGAEAVLGKLHRLGRCQ